MSEVPVLPLIERYAQSSRTPHSAYSDQPHVQPHPSSFLSYTRVYAVRSFTDSEASPPVSDLLAIAWLAAPCPQSCRHLGSTLDHAPAVTTSATIDNKLRRLQHSVPRSSTIGCLQGNSFSMSHLKRRLWSKAVGILNFTF